MSFHCAAKLNEVWHVLVRFDKLGLSELWRQEHKCFTEMSVAVWNLILEAHNPQFLQEHAVKDADQALQSKVLFVLTER